MSVLLFFLNPIFIYHSTNCLIGSEKTLRQRNSNSRLLDCWTKTLIYRDKLTGNTGHCLCQMARHLGYYENLQNRCCAQIKLKPFRFLIIALIVINPFIPDFLKWTLQFFNLDMFTAVKRSFSLLSKTGSPTV